MKNNDTKSNFFIAFWDIYDKKRIEKISIRELCESAGYNRSTFYAHFEDIYGLLEEAIDEIISPAINKLIKVKDLDNLVELNLLKDLFFIIFNENERSLKMIFKNNHHYILEEKVKNIIRPFLKDMLIDDTSSKLEIDYYIEYQISAILGVLKFWFLNKDHDISEKELSRLLFNVSTQGFFLTVRKLCKSSYFNSADHDNEIINGIINNIKGVDN